MISSRLVATTRTDVRTAIALLLLAEATLCFTYLLIVGPITTLERLLPLAVVLVLCAALFWGQHRAQWALLAPIAFRAWTLMHLTAAAWDVGSDHHAIAPVAVGPPDRSAAGWGAPGSTPGRLSRRTRAAATRSHCQAPPDSPTACRAPRSRTAATCARCRRACGPARTGSGRRRARAPRDP